MKARGWRVPIPFQPPVTYQVPADKRVPDHLLPGGQRRAGNDLPGSDAPRQAHALLPGRREGAIHVPLAVLEDIPPGSPVEILIAAPAGLKSSVLIDVGFLEIA